MALPYALARKYPNAGKSLPWKWVFPATRRYVDPDTGELGHKDVSTTMIYTHFLNRGALGV